MPYFSKRPAHQQGSVRRDQIARKACGQHARVACVCVCVSQRVPLPACVCRHRHVYISHPQALLAVALKQGLLEAVAFTALFGDRESQATWARKRWGGEFSLLFPVPVAFCHRSRERDREMGLHVSIPAPVPLAGPLLVGVMLSLLIACSSSIGRGLSVSWVSLCRWYFCSFLSRSLASGNTGKNQEYTYPSQNAHSIYYPLRAPCKQFIAASAS